MPELTLVQLTLHFTDDIYERAYRRYLRALSQLSGGVK